MVGAAGHPPPQMEMGCILSRLKTGRTFFQLFLADVAWILDGWVGPTLLCPGGEWCRVGFSKKWWFGPG